MKLLGFFNIVLMMDNTYKTNRYRMSLLEIVGVIFTRMTFSIVFAFLSSERDIYILKNVYNKIR